MISIYDAEGAATNEYTNAERLRAAVWIDLLNPSSKEAAAVERALNVRLPTRSQVQEIEVSSRLYTQADFAFMTATVIVGARTPHPETMPVTFVYEHARVVTLCFAEPTAISIFTSKYRSSPASYATAEKILMGLLDEIVDRLADTLEMVSGETTSVSQAVFTGAGADGPHFTKPDRYTRVN